MTPQGPQWFLPVSSRPNQSGSLLIKNIVTEFANDGEISISILRVVLCLLLLTRNLFLRDTVWADTWPHLLQRIQGMLVIAAVSAAIVIGARKRKLGPLGHSLCALFDSILCFLSLRTNVIWASGGYAGLSRMPDSAFPALIVFASALRLYWVAVATSWTLNSVSILLLLRLDASVNASRIAHGSNDPQILVLQIAAAGALALVTAWAVRRALRRLAAEASRATRGRHHLRTVIREHHDVRSLLTAARLQLESMDRARKGLDTKRRLSAAERAIIAIDEILDSIRNRTFGELSENEDIEEIDPVEILRSAVAVARSRFPDTRIETTVALRVPKVLLFGGNRVLAHIVVNLLVNACEGDGKNRAQLIKITVTQEFRLNQRVVFEFKDDGPGFRPELLKAPFRGGLSTKARGTGLGLSFIAEVVQSSGGGMAVRNRVPCGACVSLWLRCAR